MSACTAARYLVAAVMIATPVHAMADQIDDQVRASYSAWNAAFNKGDPKAIAAFYTVDTAFLPATHDVIQTQDGVEKFFSTLLASGVTDHRLDLIGTTQEGKILIAVARWSAAGKDASGKATQFSGVATHMFERQSDGSLKLKLHTFN